MVVARNQDAASSLCQAWRERELVKKIYLAHVVRWPPYHQSGEREGTINIPLAPSRTERIKWQVLPVADGGKECKTYWKVHEDHDTEDSATSDDQSARKGVTLELQPITGRTHQLRLHCAAIGSGIVGDSLYGDSPIVWRGDDAASATTAPNQDIDSDSTVPRTLRLHAHKLTFLHPKTGDKATFTSPRSW